MVKLGTPAPEFSLPDLDATTVSLSDFAGEPVLVMFVCNHCPYVKHLEQAIGALAGRHAELRVLAVCSNDAQSYPDDDVAGLREQADRAGWGFPYLVDAAQQVARNYRAACTPDFFLYDAQHRLAYRGAFDDSTPGNGKAITGEHLDAAVQRVLAGEPVPEPHHPSTGCSIKWRD
jgi:peroxiredoxin